MRENIKTLLRYFLRGELKKFNNSEAEISMEVKANGENVLEIYHPGSYSSLYLYDFIEAQNLSSGDDIYNFFNFEIDKIIEEVQKDELLSKILEENGSSIEEFKKEISGLKKCKDLKGKPIHFKEKPLWPTNSGYCGVTALTFM